MSQDKVPTSLRVLNLALALLNTPRGLSRSDLMASIDGYGQGNLDTARRSFERDLEHLRRAGLIVEVNDRFEGATYRIARSSLGPSASFLSKREVQLLLEGAHAWAQPGSAEATLRNKLLGYTDRPLGVQPSATRYELEDGEGLDVIGKGIAEKRALEFEYLSRSRQNLRHVAPWRVVVHGRSLYLWGFDLDEAEPRLYRVSRFQSPPRLIDGKASPESSEEWQETPLDESQFAVSPLLRVRRGAAAETILHSTPEPSAPMRSTLEPSVPRGKDEWSVLRGEKDDVSVWEQRVLREADGVVVLDPEWLAESVAQSLEAAARWGGEHG